MFKRLKIYFLGAVEDNPALVLSMIPSLIILFLLSIWSTPIYGMLTQVIPENVIDAILGISIFSLMGIIGIITIRFREAPVFLIPITGIAAILIGLFLFIGGFGIVIMLIYYDFTGHPLIHW